MKNLFAILLASMMMVSFAACSSNKDTASASNQSNTETVSTDEETSKETAESADTESTDEESSGEEADQTETGSESSSESADASSSETQTAPESETSTESSLYAEEHTLTGTIVDAAMSTVTIKTDDEEELTFSIPDDADETQVDGMKVGDTLAITYTGTIQGTDTSGVTVVSLVETSADAQ